MDQLNVELDLLSITPEALEAAFLVDLKPGGIFEHATDAGVLELDGQTLALTLGSNNLEISSGSTFSDQSITMIVDDTVPLYQYPFDVYLASMAISANVVNTTDPANVTVRTTAFVPQ